MQTQINNTKNYQMVVQEVNFVQQWELESDVSVFLVEHWEDYGPCSSQSRWETSIQRVVL